MCVCVYIYIWKLKRTFENKRMGDYMPGKCSPKGNEEAVLKAEKNVI